MSNEETKQCPYCAETIKKNARICRFCQMDLETGKSISQRESTSTQSQEVQARSGVADGVKLGCGMFIVLPILIILGLLFLVMVFGSNGEADKATAERVEELKPAYLAAIKTCRQDMSTFRVCFEKVDSCKNQANNDLATFHQCMQ